MATVRAQRLLNSLNSGSLTSGQLTTALATNATLGDYQELINERGKTRLICNSTVTFPVVANSPVAIENLVTTPAGNAEFLRSSYASAYVFANPSIIANSAYLMNSYFSNSTTRSTITSTRSLWPTLYNSPLMLNNWQYYISSVTWSGPTLLDKSTALTTAGADITNWTPVALSSANNVIFYHCWYGGELRGRLLSTTDGGVTFTSRILPATSSYLRPFRVAYGNGKYVCVGYNNNTNVSQVWTSTDNVTWSGPTAVAGAANFIDVTFGAGVFVAIAQNAGIYSSTDGITWTQRVSSSSYRRVSTFDGSFFVATGSSGVIAYSTNGTSWTTTTTSTVVPAAGSRTMYRAAVGRNGQAVITGTEGWQIRTTNSGATWTGSSLSASWDVKCMDYANGLWIYYQRDGNKLFMYRNTDLNSTAGWGSAITSTWSYNNYDDSVYGGGFYMVLSETSPTVQGW